MIETSAVPAGSGSGPARRSPQQGRSRETVDRILRAADEEFGAVGPAAASTTRIARRAGVSVGALYRFFGDKEGIADALAGQYLADVEAPYTEALAAVRTPADIGDVVREVIRRAAEMQLEHPGYYRLTEELAPERDDSPAHQVRERLIELFVQALTSAGVVEPAEDLRRAIELCIETVRHTLVRAPAEPPAREATVAELERMLAAYLAERFG